MICLKKSKRSNQPIIKCIQHILFDIWLYFSSYSHLFLVDAVYSWPSLPPMLTLVYWHINRGDITSMCPWTLQHRADPKISQMFRDGEPGSGVWPDIEFCSFNSLTLCGDVILSFPSGFCPSEGIKSIQELNVKPGKLIPTLNLNTYF